MVHKLDEPKVLKAGDSSRKNPGCYLNFLGGCSDKLTKEHLISRGMMVGPSRTLHTPDGIELKNPKPLAQTAKVLCGNHNSSMSIFDTAGYGIWDALTKANRGQRGLSAVHGNEFEAFLMQRLCAHHFGGIASTNGKPIELVPSEEFIRQAFVDTAPAPYGMYMVNPPAHSVRAGAATEITSYYASGPLRVIGGRMSFGRVAFGVIFETPNLPLQLGPYRPSGLRFWMSGQIYNQLNFRWRDGAQSGFVDFDMPKPPPFGVP